ncbi:MAG: di-trans,poly-cis-decaprenylcistransferase [Tenericutes bacterium HGW-Tenericutes-6]|nr:MAG: di-trans,poly-cis-decaprenylcistransferase [Tenericutes bacterium HGW-Tenericutes-6]
MNEKNIPKHVAIILDGNGRWAKKYGQPRSFGHYQGGRNLFKVAKIAQNLGIEKLSVYAFSTENWKRPKEEVDYLMSKPVELFHENKHRMHEINYKITFAGRRDRFSPELLDVINTIEKETKDFNGFELTLCVDYGSYDEIIRAVNELEKPITESDLVSKLMVKEPVDLLIRTSGEMRLSNFLLWQVSYAEFYFTKVHWPAFNEKELKKAIKSYQQRHRRFGGLK